MGALIPALISTLVPLIPSIINVVETAFGPKTGETKLSVATQTVKTIADQLATAGKIPGQVDPNLIGALIELVFGKMKADGDLKATPAVPQTVTVQGPTGSKTYSGAFTVTM